MAEDLLYRTHETHTTERYLLTDLRTYLL